MPHAASMPPPPHVFQLLHFSAQCPATPIARPALRFPAHSTAHSTIPKASSHCFNLRFACFCYFSASVFPSCFCSTRVFTQIHCFNLLKFVDRKQKLINGWALAMGGSLVLAGSSKASEVTEQLQLVPLWNRVKKPKYPSDSIYFLIKH